MTSSRPVFTKINLSVVLLLILFIFFTARYITVIGLNYDELFFVNAALGGVGDEMIFKRIFNIPFMVLPDLGAIKSYLYYPIFKLWGVNNFSIRIPPIIFSALTLWVWFEIAGKMIGKGFWALAFLALMVTDPAFIMNTRVDLGPIVLQNLLIALTIWCYQQSLEKKSIAYFTLAALAMVIGIANKINFLWFIFSFLYVVFLYDFAFIVSLGKRHLRIFNLVILVFSLALFAILFYLIIPAALHFPIGGMSHVGLMNKIFYVPLLYLNTFNGFNNFHVIFHKALDVPSLVNAIELPCMAIWLFSMLIMRIFKIRNSIYESYIKSIRFFFMLFVVEFLCMLFTPHTRSPSHAMILWPLAHLLFILVIAAISQSFFHRRFVFLAKFAILVVLASQCYADYQFDQAFKSDPNSPNELWTPAIYPLSDFVNAHINTFDNVMFADRGISTPVFALANNNVDRLKMHEFWFLFADNVDMKQCAIFIHPHFSQPDAANQQWLYQAYYHGKHNLVVMFANVWLTSNVKNGFLAFADKYHIQLQPIATISDGNGKDIYRLYLSTDSS